MHPFRPVFHVLVGQHLSLALEAQAPDVFRAVKNGEVAPAHPLRQIGNLHVKTEVRLVGTVARHGLVVTHPGEAAQLHIFHAMKKIAREALEGPEYFLLGDEGHLAVDLGKFRLAIRAKVLVAKALHYLKILVHARHHQYLLECLRRLRQRVKLAAVQTARHDKIAGTLGRTLDENRRLYFDEPLLGQVLPRLDGHTAPEYQLFLDGLAADVEVAVFHAQLIAPVGVRLNGEGGRL